MQRKHGRAQKFREKIEIARAAFDQFADHDLAIDALADDLHPLVNRVELRPAARHLIKEYAGGKKHRCEDSEQEENKDVWLIYCLADPLVRTEQLGR